MGRDAVDVLTDDQLATVRAEVGSEPDDDTLSETYDRWVLLEVEDPIKATILSTLSRRQAELLSQPSSLTVPGAVSVDYGGTITGLERKIEDVRGRGFVDEDDIDGGNVVQVAQLRGRRRGSRVSATMPWELPRLTS